MHFNAKFIRQIPMFPSPLTGEGEGGGDEMPFSPSLLSPPVKGGDTLGSRTTCPKSLFLWYLLCGIHKGSK